MKLLYISFSSHLHTFFSLRRKEEEEIVKNIVLLQHVPANGIVTKAQAFTYCFNNIFSLTRLDDLFYHVITFTAFFFFYSVAPVSF